MNIKDIEKLAHLSRIAMSDEEKSLFLKEIDSILAYVGELKKAAATVEKGDKKPVLKNVIREDKNPHESEENTEVLLSSAPKRQGQYIKVKKIL